MSIFFDLFNPNNRHRTEELRRMENTREEDAQGEPGRGPIDLNSGTVLIRVPDKEQDTPEDGAATDAALEDSAPEDSAPESSAPEDGDAAASDQEDGGA